MTFTETRTTQNTPNRCVQGVVGWCGRVKNRQNIQRPELTRRSMRLWLCCEGQREEAKSAATSTEGDSKELTQGEAIIDRALGWLTCL